MEIADTLSSFIQQDLLEGRAKLERTTPLFSSRLLDSVALVELLSYVEEEFGVKVKASEMRPENLDTVDALVQLIQGKLDSGGEARPWA